MPILIIKRVDTAVIIAVWVSITLFIVSMIIKSLKNRKKQKKGRM